jgi:hypothetical protein
LFPEKNINDLAMADELNINDNNKRPLEDDLTVAEEESGNN